MIRRLQVEDIYDAALDDALFDALPARLAASLDARSGVLHWQDERQPDLGELRHSHYFDDAQLAALDADFAHEDIWSAAVRRARNRAWRCDDLVATHEYAHSRIYNEWIRAMGDDSFHCLGASLSDGVRTVELGFHRARSQGAFTDREVSWLQAALRPLDRVMAMRARLIAADARNATLAAALDSGGDAVFVLDDRGRPLHANHAGERLLVRGDGVLVQGGALRGGDVADDHRLQAALRAAGAREGACGTSLTLHNDDGAPRIMSLLPAAIDGRRRIVAVMAMPDRSGDREERIAALHGLSAAEAAVAVMIADGHAPADIADLRHARIATVRSQIKAILGKIGGTRQVDIAVAIQALPRLAGHGDEPSSSARRSIRSGANGPDPSPV